MGATTCNGLCEKDSRIQSFDDQYTPTQTLVPCQLCNLHFEGSNFKRHLDRVHYSCIVENKAGLVEAECLLCLHISENLEQHVAHLSSKHPFVKQAKKNQEKKAVGSAIVEEKEEEKLELFRVKKGRMVRLKSQKEFQVLRQDQGKLEVAIRGEKYTGEVKTKQYRGAEFEQSLAEGELVWYRAFQSEEYYEYYFFDSQPKERTILCKAYLFARKAM